MIQLINQKYKTQRIKLKQRQVNTTSLTLFIFISKLNFLLLPVSTKNIRQTHKNTKTAVTMKNLVNFRIYHNKISYDISFNELETIQQLRLFILCVTGKLVTEPIKSLNSRNERLKQTFKDNDARNGRSYWRLEKCTTILLTYYYGS